MGDFSDSWWGAKHGALRDAFPPTIIHDRHRDFFFFWTIFLVKVAEVAECVGRESVDAHDVCQKVGTATRTRMHLVIAHSTMYSCAFVLVSYR